MILGLDTSRWSDNPKTVKTVDWQVAKETGAKFVIMKATEGTGWKDPVFDLHSKALKGVLPRGSYHYWRPQFTAKAQADFYRSVAGDLELPPCLDLEDYYAELPKGALLERRVIEALEAVDAAFGRECVLYTSPNIIKYYLQLKASSPLCNRKLWIANYGVKAPVIYPFQKWTFWQFSETGEAAKYGINESQTVDLNLYNGTQAEFEAEFGLGEVPKPTKVNVIYVSREGGLVPELLKVGLDVDGVVQVAEVDQRPVVVPPAPPPPVEIGAGIYLILNDVEAGIEPNGPRPFVRDGKVGPPTVKLEGGPAYYRIPDKWVSYLGKINSTQAMNYIFKPGSGWQNGTEPYVVRTITFAGNIVEVLRIGDVVNGKLINTNRAYVKTISLDENPPVVLIKPTQAKPHTLVHMFTIQYILSGGRDDPKSTVRLDYTTDERYASILLMAPVGEKLWIDVRNLKKV